MNRSPNYGPSDIFKTSDGRIIVQVIGPAMFKRWARLVGRPELLKVLRFEDDSKRGEHGHLLSEMMSQWCATRTRGR